MLGSEKDIYLFSLIFGTTKYNDWLNILEIFSLLKSGTLKIYKDLDEDKIICDKKYDCKDPERKILDLLSEKGAINLDKYISQIEKKYLNIIAYYLNRDRYLLNEVYDRLPNCHKKIVITNPFEFFFYPFIYSNNAICRDIGSSYINSEQEVREHVRFVMERIKDKIINEFEEKNIPNENIRKITGDTLYNIRKNYSHIFENSKHYLKEIDRYIYGGTPMKRTFQDTFSYITNFRNEYEENIIFLLSDGESTDGNPEEIVKNELTKTNSILITCYLSSFENECPKILYDENTEPKNLVQGEKILYEMSSSVSSANSIFTFLEEKGWKVPHSGRCKLFLRANNPKIIDEYLSLITMLIKGNDALFDLVGKIDFEKYINNNINSFKPKMQHGGTCYAHAIATVIHMSLSRIYGRIPPTFEDIKNSLIQKYGEHGAYTEQVLKNELPKYKLHYKELNETEAKEAILKGRPCIFTFYLDKIGWAKFSKFYNENKGGKLTKEIFDNIKNYGDDTSGGHAVVFVKYGSNYLEFINSWGINWNNGGFFRVGDLKFFQNVRFFDVFWFLSDLTDQDKKNWEQRNQQIIKDNLSRYKLFNYKIECPKCKQIIEAEKFKGTFYKAECPLCGFKFVPNIEQLAKTLYIKQNF